MIEQTLPAAFGMLGTALLIGAGVSVFAAALRAWR